MKIEKISLKKFLKKIPLRNIDANKGDFGHVLIIGGDFQMAGAVIMAAEAACRAGAGRVSVLTHQENFLPLMARLPNVMTVIYKEKKDLKKILSDKTIIVIGPGLGQSKWSKGLFDEVMNSNLPKVIDADALNILSKSKKNYNLENSIITPHPKETSRLLALAVEKIQENRNLAVTKLYEKYGAVTILKGHHSLITNDGGKIYLCPYGNAGMAVAGMGDILSGIIAGLLAQKISLVDSAILGAALHGHAGDLAAKNQGEIGMIPHDLFKYVLELVNG